MTAPAAGAVCVPLASRDEPAGADDVRDQPARRHGAVITTALAGAVVGGTVTGRMPSPVRRALLLLGLQPSDDQADGPTAAPPTGTPCAAGGKGVPGPGLQHPHVSPLLL